MHDQTPLYLATMEGDREEVERLLASSAKLVNVGDVNGNTPLHVAATDGRESIANLLLQAGADVNNANDNGDTPLHLAAWQGHVKIAEMLLFHHAALDLQNAKRWTPVYSATRATDGCHQVARLLIRHGARVDLNSALRLEMTDHARQLLSCAGPSTISHIALFPSMLLTDAIDYTCNDKDLCDLVALLLRSGADPNGSNYSNETPLLVASRRSNMPLEVFRLLLKFGADPNRVQYTDSPSAADIAEHAENSEAAKLLRKG